MIVPTFSPPERVADRSKKVETEKRTSSGRRCGGENSDTERCVIQVRGGLDRATSVAVASKSLAGTWASLRLALKLGGLCWSPEHLRLPLTEHLAGSFGGVDRPGVQPRVNRSRTPGRGNSHVDALPLNVDPNSSI